MDDDAYDDAYDARWSDNGSVTLVHPGPDARVQHPERRSA
ncbi:DUF1918 domain-containing protein [Streptomyces sp. UNOC14_S4]|nr:DUF1918 domain-containing protein [Streptomyces sp. UNOC14_S4]